MSQSTVTDFFSVRRRAPDQHASKRRKIALAAEIPIQQDSESPVVDECTTETITSATDQHTNIPKTPSTISKDGSKNSRQSKRSSRESTLSPGVEEDNEEVKRFTPGSSARKQLDWKKESTKPRRNVEFTKLSSVSPKKTRPDSVLLEAGGKNITEVKESGFKVPTPVKELIGARRPKVLGDISKNLFGDDTENKAMVGRPKRSGIAEVDRASDNVTKLTPQELKAKLGKVGSLADLKKRLTSLKADAGQLEKIRERRAACIPRSPVKAGIEIHVPVPASPSKVSRVPEVGAPKVSPRKVPAYERYAYLTRPVSKTLVLPYNYKMLAEVFRCTDTVVSMLFNRREPIIFSKLAKSVQDMMRKNFGEKYLKQLKCVFPQAYLYAWEKVLNKYGQKKDEYQLRISPNLDFKKDILSDYGASDIDAIEKNSSGKLSPELLVERRGIFHNSLIQLVKDQHRMFLAGLDPPIHVVDSQLTRWHKSFDPESCHEIDTLDLPTKPQVGEKMTTAKEVLEKANQIFNINPKLAESLQDAAAVIQGSEPAPAPKPAEPAPVVPKALKGLNPKLLQLIRAKEANKARVEMTRDVAELKKIKQLKRLPHLARLTRSLFVSEKKASLAQEFVVKKLVQSYPGSVESSTIEEDLRELCVCSEGWLALHLVRTTQFVRLDASRDINIVTTNLELKLKQAEAV